MNRRTFLSSLLASFAIPFLSKRGKIAGSFTVQYPQTEKGKVFEVINPQIDLSRRFEEKVIYSALPPEMLDVPEWAFKWSDELTVMQKWQLYKKENGI